MAWRRHNVPQCGYCQAGQIMQAAAFLKETPMPADADIDNAMSGNICLMKNYSKTGRVQSIAYLRIAL
jgi:isoquinoline 1-oxidoreductase subunit alpha